MEGLLCVILRGLLLLRSLGVRTEARRSSPSKEWHPISTPQLPLAPWGHGELTTPSEIIPLCRLQCYPLSTPQDVGVQADAVTR